MIRDGKCATCRYWEEHDATAQIGWCHRYPPSGPGDIVRNVVMAAFPNCRGGNWCGEYLPKKGKS